MRKSFVNTVFLLVILLLCFSKIAFSQKEGNIWYFGGKAGISFNSGSPVALTNSAMFQYDGCATISDSNGNLLFYSNGVDVWNKNHTIMDNGNGLLGGYASTQSCVAVKKPKSDSIYYLFTVDDVAGPNGFCYSVISMKRNGGLGKVISKNTKLLYPTTEKVTAVRHRNKTDIWVITHGWDTNAFFAYLVTPSGISSTPVVSSVGTKHSGSLTRTAGYMKVSPNGKKIAWAITTYNGIVEILDFDDSTGKVSNPITCTSIKDPYGIEFSPDGTKLYVSSRAYKEIYEFFLEAGSAYEILNSMIKVATSAAQLGAMQVAIDGRIYVAREDKYLGIINAPNAYGAACKYVDKAFYLAGRDSKFGLPTFNQSYFYNPEYQFKNFCYGDSTEFIVTSSSLVDSVRWYFGDAASSDKSSNKLIAKHKYTSSGIFTVNLVVYLITSAVDTLSWTIKIHPKPNASFNINDSTQCQKENQAFMINNTTIIDGTFKSYWDFGDGDTSSAANPLHKFKYEDTFTVQLITVSDKGCKDTFYRKMVVFPSPKPDFDMNDSAQCFDRNKYEFTNKSTISSGNLMYDWDFGDGATSKMTHPTHIYTVADTFTVTLVATSDHYCRDTAQKKTYIMLYPTPISAFAIDDSFQCLYGNKFMFTNNSFLTTGTMTFRWSFGDGDSSYATDPQHVYTNDGVYNVKLTVISDKNCKDHKVKKVYVNPMPDAFFTVDDSAQCLRNNQVKFTNKTKINSGIVNYTWDFDDGNYSNLVNPDHKFAYYDTFVVSLLTVSDAGCLDSFKKPIVIYPMPIVDFSINKTQQCLQGNVFQFTNESTIGYGKIISNQWSMGDGKKYTSSNALHNYSTPGNYDVLLTLVSDNGCRDSITKKVFVFPMPKANFSINDIDQCLSKNIVICKDSSKITSGTIAARIWDMGDGTTYTDQNIFHNYTVSDTFDIKLKVVSDQGCFDSLIKKVLIYPMPKVNFDVSDPDQCLSGNIFSFQDKTTIFPGVIQQLNWSLSDGYKTNVPSFNRSFTKADTFTVKLVAVSGVGCRDSIIRQVYVRPMPKADFTINNPQQCLSGNNFSFSNKSTVSYGSIISNFWTFGDGGNSSALHPVYTYSNDNTYGVKLLITSNFGCRDSVVRNVTVFPMPKVDFNVNNPCLDKTTFLEDKSTINPPGIINQWLWKINGTDLSTSQNTQQTFTNPGIYEVTLFATSKDNCQSSATKYFRIAEHVTQNSVVRSTVIHDDEILTEWTPTTSGAPLYYIIERSDNGLTYGALANLPAGTFSFRDKNVDASTNSYYYRVYVRDSCGYTTSPSNIGKTIRLTVNTDGDSPLLQWNAYEGWDNGVDYQEIELKDENGYFKTIEKVNDKTFYYLDLKTTTLLNEYCYRITAHEKNSGVYSNSNEVCVSVPLLLWPPNAFTPNGDEVNDEFLVQGKYVSSFNIQIFNRWGELMFESKDMNKSWDGKFNGQLCPNGLYYYRIEAKGTKNQVKIVTGTLHLLR
ncbi:MAG: PKD domain-containing protein [Sphingobacteriales bacterium]|nr:PKD domain-containing protein [Sphingobacteriales bacterium]